MRSIRGAVLLIVTLACCMAGCGQAPQQQESAQQESQPKQEKQGPETADSAEEAEAAGFRLEVEAPETVGRGEPWFAQGILLNTSGRDIEIMHGADLFRYELYDADHERVERPESTVAIDDIGFATTLQHDIRYEFDGSEHISARLNEWTLAEPGRYTLRVTASFTVEPDGEQVVIDAEPTIITVE